MLAFTVFTSFDFEEYPKETIVTLTPLILIIVACILPPVNPEIDGLTLTVPPTLKSTWFDA
jgi:hypothetical protein